MSKTLHAETLTSRALPAGWERDPSWTRATWEQRFGPSTGLLDTARYLSLAGYVVVETLEDHGPGYARWHHVSVSLPDRIPSWEELKLVKRLFIGPHREAVQYLPMEREYVNHHPFTLHLWAALDRERVTPDMHP